MKPRVVAVDRDHPDPDVIAAAAEILAAGGLVAFPTETVYGLGANALDIDAVARVFEAKGRPPTNPIIVHVDTTERARSLAARWPAAAEALARAFWPGPLTIVVPRGAQIPPIVSAGLDTFGVRIPAHHVARALITAAGVPLAAPSANRYTEVSPTTAAHVVESLGEAVDLVLDGGPCEVGIESTVVRVEDDGVTLLRPGRVTMAELERIVGTVIRNTSSVADDLPRHSPGQSARHYAPRARIVIARWDEAPRSRSTGALLLETEHAVGARFVATMPHDPQGYASSLYAAFRAADDAGCDVLVVEPPPTTPEWEAVLDRLHRAATRRA